MLKPDVIVEYGADTTQLDRAMQAMPARFAALGTSISKAVGGGLIGTALSAGFVTSTRNAMVWADSIANAADRVGQSIETVQTLRLEAEKFGLTTTATDTALQRFARRLAEAQQGTGVLASAFEQYNVELLDTQGNLRSTEDVLESFAAVLQGIDEAGELARVSMAAFDTDGVKLGQTLHNMSGSISDTSAMLEELGRIIDQDSIRTAAALETRWTEMMQRMETETKSAIISMLDWFGQLFGVFGTLGQVQNRMIEVENELVEVGSRGGSGRNARGNNLAVQRLEEELVELQKVEGQMIATRQAKEALAAATSSTANTPAASGGGGGGGRSPSRSSASTADREAQRFADSLDRVRATVDEAWAAQDRYTEQLDILGQALEKDILLESEYISLVEKSADKYDDATKKQANATDDLATTWDSLGNSVGNTLSGMIQGTRSASDAIKGLLADIAQLATKAAVEKFLLPALGLSATAATGMTLASGSSLSPGVVSSPTLFTFANGGRLGLAGEAGSEAILPLSRGPSGNLGVEASMTAPTVNINNYAGADIQTRPGLNPGDIDIIVQRVADDVVRGGTPIGRSMESAYGLTRGRR